MEKPLAGTLRHFYLVSRFKTGRLKTGQIELRIILRNVINFNTVEPHLERARLAASGIVQDYMIHDARA